MTYVMYFLSILFLLMDIPAHASESLSLEAYLKHVNVQARELQALDMDIQSLHKEIDARDLELSPTLSVDLIKFWDDRPSLSSNRQVKGKSAEVVLSKPFASGTELTLSSYLETADYSSTADEQNLLNWQAGITQSLWQNSFGRQVGFRRKRDSHELQSRLLTLLLKRQQVLNEFEMLYWDIAYRLKEVDIRQKNLERATRILDWIKDRVSRSAAERVDLLQAETLLLSRQMQLQLAQELLASAVLRLKQKLHINADIVPDVQELERERVLLSLAATASFAPVSAVLIESLQAQSQAGFLKSTSDLESDQLRPELELGYSYGRQGLSMSFSTARRQAFSGSTDKDYHQVGLVFSMPLDVFLVSKSRFAKQIAAQAQQLRAVQFVTQSALDWEDIESTVRRQKERLVTARELARLQEEKSLEEQARYEKGRATAFEAITMEQEAAESRLLVYQLLYQLRQTEARARLYIVQEAK